MKERCTKCDSDRIIPPIKVMDQGDSSDGRLKAYIGCTNPEAWLFKGAVYAQFSATICGECGHTELTAEKPAALYEAYLDSKRTQSLGVLESPPGKNPL
ncbi:MAG: hypothetical protein IAF94_15005 [Pirellulaceae bacterium]|nr:hypothetical protein [Pirellulaceae bacterium]